LSSFSTLPRSTSRCAREKLTRPLAGHDDEFEAIALGCSFHGHSLGGAR
jgi:hypothetical protein